MQLIYMKLAKIHIDFILIRLGPKLKFIHLCLPNECMSSVHSLSSSTC